MDMKAGLIFIGAALVLAVIVIVLLTAAWLKAEYMVYKLGGDTKWFRTPKSKKSKEREK